MWTIDEDRMRPGMNTGRRELPARGRGGAALTVVVSVYRNTVWVSPEPAFASDVVILAPAQVEGLITTLTWAATEARRYSSS